MVCEREVAISPVSAPRRSRVALVEDRGAKCRFYCRGRAPKCGETLPCAGCLDTQPDYSSDPHAKVTRNAADAGTGGPLAANGLNLACVYILDPPPAQTCSIW